LWTNYRVVGTNTKKRDSHPESGGWIDAGKGFIDILEKKSREVSSKKF
jgi:hypothetical protein